MKLHLRLICCANRRTTIDDMIIMQNFLINENNQQLSKKYEIQPIKYTKYMSMFFLSAGK